MATIKSRPLLLLQRELYRLQKDTPWGVRIELVQSNLFHWRVELQGLLGSDWEGTLTHSLGLDRAAPPRLTRAHQRPGALLICDLHFPETYDTDPPVVQLLTVPFHPNVRPQDGTVHTPLLEYWAAGTDTVALLVTLQQLLAEPPADEDLDDTCRANPAAAHMLRNMPRAFRQRVRDMAVASRRLSVGLDIFSVHPIAPPDLFPASTDSALPSSSPRRSLAPPPRQFTSHSRSRSHSPRRRLATIPPKQGALSTRTRRVRFDDYLAGWQTLATTVAGTTARIGRATSPSTAVRPSTGRRALTVAPPVGDRVLAVIPRGDEGLVVGKPGMIGVAGVARANLPAAEAQAVMELEHDLKYGRPRGRPPAKGTPIVAATPLTSALAVPTDPQLYMWIGAVELAQGGAPATGVKGMVTANLPGGAPATVLTAQDLPHLPRSPCRRTALLRAESLRGPGSAAVGALGGMGRVASAESVDTYVPADRWSPVDRNIECAAVVRASTGPPLGSVPASPAKSVGGGWRISQCRGAAGVGSSRGDGVHRLQGGQAPGRSTTPPFLVLPPPRSPLRRETKVEGHERMGGSDLDEDLGEETDEEDLVAWAERLPED
ncbi:Ubiquitin-conjugating enzyme E2 U [Allomyces javanicus]|nr:Ubiquitin-conjugating enzyme E2 U [Allomyces javanicus]